MGEDDWLEAAYEDRYHVDDQDPVANNCPVCGLIDCEEDNHDDED